MSTFFSRFCGWAFAAGAAGGAAGSAISNPIISGAISGGVTGYLNGKIGWGDPVANAVYGAVGGGLFGGVVEIYDGDAIIAAAMGGWASAFSEAIAEESVAEGTMTCR